MATPEQDFDSGRAMTTLVRVLAAGGVTVVGAAAWLYTQVSDMATERAEDAHDKAAMHLRIETIEIQARLHQVGQHEVTRRQRVKDVRELLKQLVAADAELLKLVPARSRMMVRRRLREHRDRLTDSLIGD